MSKSQQRRTRPLPSLTLARQIGKTLYVMQGGFAATATEDATQKIKRLLLKEIEENGQKNA